MIKKEPNKVTETVKVVAKNPLRYFLHFIGTGLYSKESFTIEAEKLGVNRSFPAMIAKHFNFGDKILLAQYETTKTTTIEDKVEREGKAAVFGYYVIDGVTFNAQSNQDFAIKLGTSLDIVKNITLEKPQLIERECGQYYIEAQILVTNSLKDIAENAMKIAKELGIKLKVFLSGKFYQFAMKDISPIKFTRLGTWIELDNELEGALKDKCVTFAGDYEKRKYFLKDELIEKGRWDDFKKKHPKKTGEGDGKNE